MKEYEIELMLVESKIGWARPTALIVGADSRMRMTVCCVCGMYEVQVER